MQTVWEFALLLSLYFRVFLTTYVFDKIPSTLGFAEVFQKYQQSIKNHDTFKMYQYHGTPPWYSHA